MERKLDSFFRQANKRPRPLHDDVNSNVASAATSEHEPVVTDSVHESVSISCFYGD